MKQVILDVLEDVSQGQVNLKSEAARETVANLIMAGIKTKGWYLNLGRVSTRIKEEQKLNEKKLYQDQGDGHLIQLAQEDWICSICNKHTYYVDSDYIGSGTNHLECELKQDD